MRLDPNFSALLQVIAGAVAGPVAAEGTGLALKVYDGLAERHGAAVLAWSPDEARAKAAELVASWAAAPLPDFRVEGAPV
jgi:hypothetical protein